MPKLNVRTIKSTFYVGSEIRIGGVPSLPGVEWTESVSTTSPRPFSCEREISTHGQQQQGKKKYRSKQNEYIQLTTAPTYTQAGSDWLLEHEREKNSSRNWVKLCRRTDWRRLNHRFHWYWMLWRHLLKSPPYCVSVYRFVVRTSRSPLLPLNEMDTTYDYDNATNKTIRPAIITISHGKSQPNGMVCERKRVGWYGTSASTVERERVGSNAVTQRML